MTHTDIPTDNIDHYNKLSPIPTWALHQALASRIMRSLLGWTLHCSRFALRQLFLAEAWMNTSMAQSSNLQICTLQDLQWLSRCLRRALAYHTLIFQLHHGIIHIHFLKWNQRDTFTRSTILLNVVDPNGLGIDTSGTAAQMWKSLIDKYSVKSVIGAINARAILENTSLTVVI